MPPTETPPTPNTSVPTPPPAPESELPPEIAPIKVSTRRHGEIDHSELVHLLDSLEGDQAKSRFRESIYISVIVYLMIAWLVVYGPKYVFHTGQVVPSAAEKQEKERLTQMELNRDIAKLNEQPKPAPKPPPKLDRRALEQLQAMQRANEAAKAARQAPEAPAPAPAPAPSPAPAPPAVAQTQPPAPLPSNPSPQPRPAAPSSSIPDAPHPNTTAAPSVSSSIADATRNSGSRLGSSRVSPGTGARVGQQGAGTGAEILSDTRGVDFTEYIKRLLRAIKAQWLPLIPEECYPPLSKEGTTLIRFTIDPDGKISAMNLDDSTHDRAIDHAAWGAITGVGQFAPLPKEFSGPNLELRITFIISRTAPDAN